VAVIGAGSIAEYHLAILRECPAVEIVAVVDRDRAKAERAARRLEVEHALERAAELVPLAIDVAHVLVPPELHAEVARELLGLGISAFVEKPLALSAAEAR
jgi:predicted dehydrogenase